MADTALTTVSVKKLIYTWFKKLTDHAPVDEMLAMLNVDSLQMKFPEATLTSEQQFRDWYTTVTNKFFDQVHELKMLDVALDGDVATVELVVNWQARTWEPPAGYSGWEGVYAHQSWTVAISDKTGIPAITTYDVHTFEPMDGPLRI